MCGFLNALDGSDLVLCDGPCLSSYHLGCLDARSKKVNVCVFYLDLLDLALILHRFVTYCTVLYYIVLYCRVLYCTVLYYTVLYCTILYCTILYYTVLYCTVPHCTVQYCIVHYYIILYFSMLINCTDQFLFILQINSIRLSPTHTQFASEISWKRRKRLAV